MKKKVTITIIVVLILLFLIPKIKTLSILFSEIENVEKVDAPKDIQNLFVNGVDIEHFESKKYKDGNEIISVFEYKDGLAIMVFKKEVPANFDLRSITISENSRIKITPNEVYFGSIFLQNLMYWFSNETLINSIKISLSNIKEKAIEKNTEKEFYLTFNIDEYFGLKFNQINRYSLFAQSIHPKENEYNELLIRKNDGHLYFFYLKPLRSIENQERGVLNRIVDFNAN